MSHLLREQAPITEAAWEQLDEEARERLKPALAARKLIDFAGPRGWRYSATNLGRTEALGDAPADGMRRGSAGCCRWSRSGRRSRSRAPSSTTQTAAPTDVDFATLDEAARSIAVAENKAVFHGWGGRRHRGDHRGLRRKTR